MDQRCSPAELGLRREHAGVERQRLVDREPSPWFVVAPVERLVTSDDVGEGGAEPLGIDAPVEDVEAALVVAGVVGPHPVFEEHRAFAGGQPRRVTTGAGFGRCPRGRLDPLVPSGLRGSPMAAASARGVVFEKTISSETSWPTTSLSIIVISSAASESPPSAKKSSSTEMVSTPRWRSQSSTIVRSSADVGATTMVGLDRCVRVGAGSAAVSSLPFVVIGSSSTTTKAAGTA